jgi:hypothetical protein
LRGEGRKARGESDISGIEMAKEQELIDQGWTKRFIYDEPRLSEAVELYESMGFEVRLEPIDMDSEDCTECMRAEPDKYKVIYTRAKDRNDRCESRMGK